MPVYIYPHDPLKRAFQRYSVHRNAKTKLQNFGSSDVESVVAYYGGRFHRSRAPNKRESDAGGDKFIPTEIIILPPGSDVEGRDRVMNDDTGASYIIRAVRRYPNSVIVEVEGRE